MSFKSMRCAAPTRAMGVFQPVARHSFARCPGSSLKFKGCIRASASGEFHSDSVGAAASTDGTTPKHSVSTPEAQGTHIPTPFESHFASVISHLRQHASVLAQHLKSAEQPAFLLSLGQGHSLLGGQPGASGPTDHVASELASHNSKPSLLSLPLHIPLSVSPRTSGHELPRPAHSPGERRALGPAFDLVYLPWMNRDASGATGGHATTNATTSAAAAISTATTSSSSDSGSLRPRPSPSDPEPTPPLVLLLLLGPSGVQAVIAARLSGLTLLWDSAVSLQQRAVLGALWHAGRAAEAAGRAYRSMPPPHEVPGLVHWGAAAAAVRAQETVVLALAHTAAAASAATAGVPAATAAVTGSAAAAAAAAAVSAPHLPLLRHARRRLLAAARGLLDQLRGLQQGCTTHVLLRFLLFSSVRPALRRDLLTRLDVLARRATQLALLQEQHDAWLACQPPTDPVGQSFPSPGTAHSAAPSGPSGPRQLHPLQGSTAAAGSFGAGAGRIADSAAAGPTPASGTGSRAASPELSARWFRSVFAPEMRACARQLRCGTHGAVPVPAPGAGQHPPAAAEAAAAAAGVPGPSDRAAADPPGRFDLRDLYRLIRVLEVAVEDLERCS